MSQTPVGFGPSRPAHKEGRKSSKLDPEPRDCQEESLLGPGLGKVYRVRGGGAQERFLCSEVVHLEFEIALIDSKTRSKHWGATRLVGNLGAAPGQFLNQKSTVRDPAAQLGSKLVTWAATQPK